jgi:hypothetical protein
MSTRDTATAIQRIKSRGRVSPDAMPSPVRIEEGGVVTTTSLPTPRSLWLAGGLYTHSGTKSGQPTGYRTRGGSLRNSAHREMAEQ